jgi:branched-chain amino acid transport system permease protein
VVQAIRQNERRARQIGYNTTVRRALAFVISGTFSGLADALYSPFIQFVSPDVLFWTFSGQVIIMTIIGGAATFYGPLPGAALFVLMRDISSSWSASSAVIAGVELSKLGEHWPLFMGLLFFLIIVFEPAGLAGVWMHLRDIWVERALRRSSVAEPRN